MEAIGWVSIIGLLGLPISLFFGVWSYITYYKYPAKITIIRENVVGLFHAYVKNFPDLTINFKGNPINEQMVLLKGIVINSGKKDITKEMVKKKLCLTLPDGFYWLDCQTTSSSIETDPIYEVKGPNELEMDLGFFRCKEYFRWEALVETPNINQGINKGDLKFTHRIADTQKVDYKEIEDVSKSLKELIAERLMVMVMAGAIGLGLAATIYKDSAILNKNAIPKITYSMEINNIKYKNINLKILKNGKVKVYDLDNDFEDQVTLEELFKKYSNKLKAEENLPSKSIILVVLFFIILALLSSLLIALFLDFLKRLTFSRILKDSTVKKTE